jgi:hypothetical protein
MGFAASRQRRENPKYSAEGVSHLALLPVLADGEPMALCGVPRTTVSRCFVARLVRFPNRFDEARYAALHWGRLFMAWFP